MPGNSRRRGAVRKRAGGNPTAGSGGRGRRALEGRGPTPKAADRVARRGSRDQPSKSAKPAKSDPGVGADSSGAGAAGQRGSDAGASGSGRADRSARKGRGEPTGRGRSTGRGHQTGRRGGGRSGGRPGGRSGGARREPGHVSGEWVAGRNALVEALRESVPVTRVYVAERLDHDDRVREVLKLAAVRRLPILEVPRAELDRLTDGAVHQGVAARVAPYDYADALEVVASARARGELPLLVALDSVTDPRNLGAVIRSAAAFGCQAVVVPERRSATMTAGAWKASAGAAARVPVAKAANLTRELRGLQEAGLTIVGLDAAGDSSLGELDLVGEPIVLVVGSEGRGLSRLVRETCDLLAAIPMTAATESLNASVAAGIALYEVARRR